MKEVIIKTILERLNRNTAPKLANLKKYLKFFIAAIIGFFVLMVALVVLVIFLVFRLILGSSSQVEVPLQDTVKNLEQRIINDEALIKELTERLNNIEAEPQ